jgi:hypothetical protein
VTIPVEEYFEGVHAIALLNAVVDVLEVNDIPDILLAQVIRAIVGLGERHDMD